MHKKNPKICTECRISKANIYLYHSTEIAKARPHSEDWQTDTSVQKQWSMCYSIDTVIHIKYSHPEIHLSFSANRNFGPFWVTL